VKIRNWQKFCASSFDPILSFVALTFGTMSVSARVVTDAQIATLITSIDMATQLGRSTFFDGIKRANLPRV
jgi:hypothetical protein